MRSGAFLATEYKVLSAISRVKWLNGEKKKKKQRFEVHLLPYPQDADVFETLVFSTVQHLTRLIAREISIIILR
jgi:hypothetical protein